MKMKAKQWILEKRFEGVPTEDNLKLVEEELPELKPNEILLKAVYLSVDPYMRAFSNMLKEGSVMMGEQLAEVIGTKNEKFRVGARFLCKAGWRSHFISDGHDLEPLPIDLTDLPESYSLGTLGMPGATAYFGMYRLANLKSDETVLVNAAAGAVGNLVGQLAKIKGCTVVAFVGSDDKVNWCKNELGFDHVFNYKNVNLSEAISKVAPDGVDVFFDNVGGDFFQTVIEKHMKHFGRILICGSISTYNEKEPKKYPAINIFVLRNELTLRGFMSATYKKEWPVAFEEMRSYIKEGKIKVRESVYDGFDKMRDAFYSLFVGKHVGKVLVNASKD